MKKLIILLGVLGLILFYSCEDDDNQNSEKVEELIKDGTLIDEISFEGDQMVLKFSNGEVVKTNAPSDAIPYIGKDGYWYVGENNLGIKSSETPDIPTLGADKYWYVGETKTTVTGDEGDNSAGSDGTIKSMTYDKTTGILKLEFADGSKQEFLLFAEESTLKGRKLGDLNGKYLLSSIWGGDMKYLDVEYDEQNRIVALNTFKNVFNAPVKQMSVVREYDDNGKISNIKYVSYAYRKMTDYYTEEDKEIRQTPVFKDGKFNIYFIDPADEDYIFVLRTKSENGSFYDRYHICPKGDTYYNGALVKEGENLYYWKSKDEVEKEDEEDVYIEYFTRKYEVKELEGTDYNKYIEENEIEYDYRKVSNYYSSEGLMPADGKSFYYLDEISYNVEYNQGDVISSLSLEYLYDGENPSMYSPLTNQFGLSVIMDGNKMDKIILAEEEGNSIEIIKFHYEADGLLSHLSSPFMDLDKIAEVLYDGQNNPIVVNVDAKQLADSERVPLHLLEMLGLICRVDSGLKMSDDEYIYPEKYAPIIKMSYDYEMKNFMGHTFRALCPIWEGFSMNNAFSEIMWAGHATGMASEYKKFNAGGYPTEIKGFLRIGAGDAINVGQLIEDFEDYPNIGLQVEPIAMVMKLKYVEAK